MHRKTELCFYDMSYVPKKRLSVHNSCRKNITRRLKHNGRHQKKKWNFPLNSRYKQFWSYALNDELCFYDMDLDMGGRTAALHRSAMFQLSDKLSQPKPSENYSKIPS